LKREYIGIPARRTMRRRMWPDRSGGPLSRHRPLAQNPPEILSLRPIREGNPGTFRRP